MKENLDSNDLINLLIKVLKIMKQLKIEFMIHFLKDTGYKC